MTIKEHNQDLLSYLNESPTPFHAVKAMEERLLKAGFCPLQEVDAWELKPHQGYFVSRNNSSLIAFTTGDGDYKKNGWRMVGAHTDSPCLKVKPNPALLKQGYFQLGVEVYGGALLNPWFDRDLSLAGRVAVACKDGTIRNELIDFKEAIATIPSLAIHLDREANKQRSVNPQTDIVPLLALKSEKPDFNQLLLDVVKQNNSEVTKVLDYELFFYDTQPAAVIGLDQEFIASARLDNLLSCHTGLMALIESGNTDQPTMLVCNDHEEVGSLSTSGADGPFLSDLLSRIHTTQEEEKRAIAKSMMISADNAHGIHPNFSDRHDSSHGPKLNAGPVIKTNANQRYATNSETSALFRLLAQELKLEIQDFVTRTDLACGSTIGPMTAGGIGVRTLDIGLPTFAMHSIRELAGSEDAFALKKILNEFYRRAELPIN